MTPYQLSIIAFASDKPADPVNGLEAIVLERKAQESELAELGIICKRRSDAEVLRLTEKGRFLAAHLLSQPMPVEVVSYRMPGAGE